MIRLTKIEKEAIARATKEQDYCLIAHGRTMGSLNEKGIAEYTSGFGYRFGAIVQLTEKGKEIRMEILGLSAWRKGDLIEIYGKK